MKLYSLSRAEFTESACAGSLLVWTEPVISHPPNCLGRRGVVGESEPKVRLARNNKKAEIKVNTFIDTLNPAVPHN